ncbi:MAG: hypothetical protein FWD82_01460 [Defluviitaleaceae bacterium]|nr:hypothetical protein [Defluviitaleaceae bacterium]
MHRSKVLRAISLLLIFSFITFSCTRNKNQIASSDFGLTAEAISEGLLLTFNNIPSDTIRLFIHVQSWCDTETLESSHDIIASFADIRDASFSVGERHSIKLEQVKETGKVIFPIAQAGQKYRISALVQTRSDINNEVVPVFIETEVIAKNGIHFNKDDVRLELYNNSAVTLSSVPLFSSEIVFDTQKFSFGVTIMVGETGSIGIGTHHIPDGLSSDGLTWVFEPQMTDNLRSNSNGWLESGNYYPAWAIAYANILHDDILWFVEIAKTPEFSFSL